MAEQLLPPTTGRPNGYIGGSATMRPSPRQMRGNRRGKTDECHRSIVLINSNLWPLFNACRRHQCDASAGPDMEQDA